MEGAGSRLGRASSRYGQQPASAASFSGPVRRWEKKWVHVSSPPKSRPSITRNQKTNASQSGSHKTSSAGSPGVLLCKWTPLSEPPAAAEDSVEPPLTPPRRRFRYTPIAVLEEKERKAMMKMGQNRGKAGEEEEARKGQRSGDHSIDGLLNINQDLVEDENQMDSEGFSTPPYGKPQFNLEMPLKAQEGSPDPGW